MEDPIKKQNEESPSSGKSGFGQEEVDALFNGDASGGTAPQAEPAEQQADSPAPESQGVTQTDIDALLSANGVSSGERADAGAPDVQAATAEPAPDTRVDSLGRPFDEASAAMQAAIEEEKSKAAAGGPPSPPSSAAPETHALELPELEPADVPDIDVKRVNMLSDVKLHVKIELGRTRMLVEDVLKLGEGGLVTLDKLAGDPVDVFVNDRLIARGEVLVLNDSFCVRISDVLSNDPHRICK